MSIHNLDAVFRPGAAGLIGASTTPGTIGAMRLEIRHGPDGPRHVITDPKFKWEDGR
jgi:hypothetical protein